jgi:hypothetical protein
MKRVFTVVMTMLLGASLALAQDTGDKTRTQTPPKTTTGKKATKVSKTHKGGKKSKKGSSTGTGTTPPPK